jgi:outer membrane protein TolC
MKYYKYYYLYVVLLLVALSRSEGAKAEPLTLPTLLKEVYQNNAAVRGAAAGSRAETALISENGALPNPKIGVMRENSPPGGGEKMMPMYSVSLSQEFMWPTRYGLMRSMQRAKSDASTHEYLSERLKVRKKAVTAYYGVSIQEKSLALLRSQKETLREIARIAEARRATGQVTQQDEMKAHVEQTKIEMELLLQQQEIASSRAELNAVMGRDPSSTLELSVDNLEVPKVTVKPGDVIELARENSTMIKTETSMVGEAELAHKLTQTAYYPEFMVIYSKPFAGDFNPENYTIELQMSLPVWFAAKESGRLEAARNKKIQAEERLSEVRRDVQKEVTMLMSQVEALSKLLKIYETALIPQAVSTLNVSRSAYSAGRASFQDLLDAERMLYSERMDFYKNFLKFVEGLVNLETVLGTSVSDLPFDKGAAV